MTIKLRLVGVALLTAIAAASVGAGQAPAPSPAQGSAPSGRGVGTVQGGIVGGLTTAPPPPPGFGGGQPPALRTGTSRIAGRILGVNGVPIRQATVRINAPQLNGSKATLTDADGRYEFREIPGGRYMVSVNKAGFINLNFGQAKPDDAPRPVVLLDNQNVDNVNIALPRGGVIAGRVIDEFGEPVTDAQVMSLQRRMQNGAIRILNMGRGAQTNDIGEFRLFGLMPGKYYVSATSRSVLGPEVSEIRTGYAPTYYPNTTTAGDAQPITVGLGDTIGSIDITLMSTRLAMISGSAIDGKGAMVRRGSVSLISRDGSSPGLPGAQILNDGTFRLNGIPPGDYIVRAQAIEVLSAPIDRTQPPRPPTPPENLIASVTVAGSDVLGVLLTPQRKVAVSGRFTFDTSPGTALRGAMLTAQSIGADAAFGGGMQNELARDDFTFDLEVPAGEVMFRAMLRTQDWVVKAIRVTGVDITDTGVDLSRLTTLPDLVVELTNHPPEVSGTVTDAHGQAIPNATIVIFPEDRSRWLFGTRLTPLPRADAQGHYSVRTLPPGKYLAVPVESFQPVNAQDPEFYEAFRGRATAFTLADQEIKTLNLVISAPR